jgi:hypothetical protein
MRFIQSIFAGAALVAAAFAVEINEFPSEVQAGRTYRVTYTPGGNTPTTFILRQGANENLDTITTLTESATGGEFLWNVDSSLPNGEDYALEIRQGTDVNYIGPIALSGGTNPTSKAASSSAASTTSAASSTITTATTASVHSTASGNGTMTSVTLSRSGTPTPSASSTESIGAPSQPSSGASAYGASSFGMLFGAVAAMAYIN